MDNVVSRIPPNDTQAEQAVLGAMLVDSEAVITAIEILKPEDFYRIEHAEIYSAMLDLYEKNKTIDLITVKDQLTIRGKYDVVNGFEYLVSLANPMYSISNVYNYAKIVEDKSTLRKLIKASNEINSASFEASEEVTTIMEEAEKKVFDIAQKRSNKGYSEIKDVLIDTMDNLEKIANQEEKIVGISSGFTDLDKKTLGFAPGQLIIIAARPRNGKIGFGFKYRCKCSSESQ